MSSNDSDDEPLSVIAAKKVIRGDDEDESSLEPTPTKKKKHKKLKKIKLKLKIPEPKWKRFLCPPEIQRPMDVWLYLKDLNVTGPYSCLLCAEWFINRSKLIIHYVLNHKKDYCGICR